MLDWIAGGKKELDLSQSEPSPKTRVLAGVIAALVLKLGALAMVQWGVLACLSRAEGVCLLHGCHPSSRLDCTSFEACESVGKLPGEKHRVRVSTCQ